jgi:hypothetical protein
MNPNPALEPDDSEAEKPIVHEHVIVLRCGAWFRLKSDLNALSPDNSRLIFWLERQPVAIFARAELVAAAMDPIDFQAPPLEFPNMGPPVQ